MSTCPQCGTAYPASVRICTRDGTVLEVEETADPRIGTVLDGKYRLDRRLGAGGMGAVYRGTHLMLGKTVAVKLIKPELVTSPDLVRRFQREARAASTLAHPNIAAAYDLGQTSDGTLYIAMEFIDGPSLKDVIRASGQIEPTRIVRILRQVGGALALAHRHDVIHRDLKPHNIALATDERGNEVAKLLDFGIAKTFDETTQLTATGFALGTPQYMSPEQATGRPVDGRSDIYALGIILYEMLVGEVPFNDPSTPAVLVKHMTEVPEHPSARRPDLGISPALEAVAMRCLEKDPNARFQTMEEFLDALESTTAAHEVPAAAATLIVPAVAAASAAAGEDVDATAAMAAPTLVPPRPVSSAAQASPAAGTTRLQAASAPPAPAAGDATTRPPAVVPPAVPAAAIGSAPPAPAVRPVASPVPPPSAPPTVEPVRAAAVPPAFPIASPVQPAPTAPVAASPVFHDKRGIGPRTLVAAAILIAVIGGGVLYGLVVLRAPREEAPQAAAADATPAAAASPSPVDTAAAPPIPSSESSGVTAPVAPATTAGSTAGLAPAYEGVSAAGSRAAQDASKGSTAPAAGATPAAQAPAPPPRAANPTVAFRCGGAADICPTIRSTVETMLRERSIPVSRDPARADIVVDARVTLTGEQTNQSFGTTFVVASYATDLEAEAVASGAAVPMIPLPALSFDNRYRTERVGDHARLIAAGVADKVLEYWKAN